MCCTLFHPSTLQAHVHACKHLQKCCPRRSLTLESLQLLTGQPCRLLTGHEPGQHRHALHIDMPIHLTAPWLLLSLSLGPGSLPGREWGCPIHVARRLLCGGLQKVSMTLDKGRKYVGVGQGDRQGLVGCASVAHASHICTDRPQQFLQCQDSSEYDFVMGHVFVV